MAVAKAVVYNAEILITTVKKVYSTSPSSKNASHAGCKTKGYVQAGQIFELVESIGATIKSFAQLALPGWGYLERSYCLARWS